MELNKRRRLQYQRDSRLLVYFAYREDLNVVKIGVVRPDRLEARMKELKTKTYKTVSGGYLLEQEIHSGIQHLRASPPLNICKSLRGPTEWFHWCNEIKTIMLKLGVS